MLPLNVLNDLSLLPQCVMVGECAVLYAYMVSWHCSALAKDGIVPDTSLLGTPTPPLLPLFQHKHTVDTASSIVSVCIMLLSFIIVITNKGYLYAGGYHL